MHFREPEMYHFSGKIKWRTQISGTMLKTLHLNKICKMCIYIYIFLFPAFIELFD